jgi:hypothetical protein
MPRETLIQVRRGLSSDWILQNPTLAEGEFGFETDTSKLKIGNGVSDWVSLNYIGSDNFIRVKNNNLYALNKGQAVYLSGYDSDDNLPSVGLYSANNDLSEQKFIGLMSSYVPSEQIGSVIIFGIFNNVDTTGNISNIALGNESWSHGDILYVSPYDYGKLTKVKPRFNIIIVGVVLNSNVNGSLLVRSFINPKFNQLNEINISNPVNNNLLKYNESLSAWGNSDQIDCGLI